MKEPIWIEKEDCLAFHSELLAMFGGLEGLRDEGMLDSALNRPLHLFNYGDDPDHFELAAAYACGLVKNHPFLDGNKRSGFMAAALFLEVNGCRFKAPEEEAVLMTRGLAAGEVEEAAYAAWLSDSSAPGE
ncbi:MAG: type II toxin-antitoxin system death-on-curing family toxin [Oceanipulchritudo sp.]|jgi:death-on-curing protein